MKFSEMPYTRVEYDEVEKQFKELMEQFKNAKSGEEQFELHKKQYELIANVQTMLTIAHIRHDIDTNDEFYDAEQKHNDEIRPKFAALLNEYNAILYNSEFRPYLEEKIGKVAFKNIELSLKSMTPEMIPLMQEENALITRYAKLMANAKIEWEGETLNLSLMSKYTTDADREVRKKAFAKTTGFMKDNAQELDEIYDALVKNRTAQAKMLGYETYTQLGYNRMSRNDYGPEQVAKFREQVKKVVVPFACKLHDIRAKRLGLDKLYYYDTINFANGDPRPVGTPEEILAEGQKMYSELSPETKEFFDCMMENELFDVLGRKTKRGGGYMTTIENYRVPFIFANFNQTSHDVEVITHEAGHAFQGYVTRNAEIREHRDITMETAEIHSMSMEFFTGPWMDAFFGDRADDFRLMHLEGAATFIPYGCMVDEFQYIVYENPDMTPEERRQVWLKLEKEYRPRMDYADNEFYNSGGLWQRQAHIYQTPFYYIDYCIAQACALQYKAWMDEDYKTAWESYLKLCNLSASMFFSDMLPEVGLKVPFVEGCLDDTIKKLSEKLGVN